MTVRMAIGAFALAGSAVCGLVTTFMNQEIVQRVNEKLPEEERFSPLGWHLSKTRRLNREYCRHFPNGRLLLIERIVGGLGFGCVVLCAWAIGFFSLL